eukprot:TRINITY_DN106326_c0_g1_i1.p1 TRINITY_DN106326_c0_g1~~TRINITY_DN106326_c0_g1_i1.p1  ORF type:complete len:460 (-),score=125.48 TRINITY_DN106326_c0_g1_i1:36-1415(-)
MNWDYVSEATAQNEKPVPGWLFREICQDAMHFPEDVPDLAEHLMRCVAGGHQTVSMKACLCIHHLAEEVPEFRRYMRRCSGALDLLASAAEPPQLAQAASLQGQDATFAREAAARALKTIVQSNIDKARQVAQVRAKCEGFGNYMPPPEQEEKPAEGVRGLVDQVAGFVGDAVGDTIDDFKEKGAVGAVKDGIADAADIIMDSVSSVWGFLGGRKVREQQQAVQRKQQERERICNPAAQDVVSQAELLAATAARQAAMEARLQAAAYPASVQQGASVGSRPPAAQVAAEPTAAPPAEPVDLLSFDDCPSPRAAPASSEDLLQMGSDSAAQPAMRVLSLKNEGNDLVKAKKYQEAVKAYEAALSNLGSELDEQSKVLASSLHANLALCFLRLELYRRAVDAASQSIQLDATHGKAYYRRCLAYKALRMNSEALRDLEALQFCRHELTDAEMKRLHQSLAP